MSVNNQRVTRSRSRIQHQDRAAEDSVIDESDSDSDLIVINEREPETSLTRRTGLRTRSVSIQTEFLPPWTLKLRTRLRNGQGVIHISVTVSMTPKILSRCILQTCGSEEHYEEMIIVGLFQESDCLFVSLEDIIAYRNSEEIYSLTYPEPMRSAPRLTFTQGIPLIILGIIIYLYFRGQSIAATAHEWSANIFEVFINLPLRELYRYGPNMVGWEGASLPEICARMTYHGDGDFWLRNMEDCQQIYSAKEEAMLRTSRPLIYLLTLIVGFFTIRSLVREYALWLSKHMEKPDRNMVETYDAFRVLFRQMSRAFNDQKLFKD